MRAQIIAMPAVVRVSMMAVMKADAQGWGSARGKKRRGWEIQPAREASSAGDAIVKGGRETGFVRGL
jgi:hypothetical protein